MRGKFLERIPAIHLSLFFMMLIVVTSFSLSSVAGAEEITYNGAGKNLRNSPSWFAESASHCLFPSASGTPLFSDNKVTIDYDPAALEVKNPEFVFGGMSASKNSMGNRVVLMNGRVEKIIFGGFSDKADSENNIVTIKGGFVGIDVLGGQSLKRGAICNAVNIGGGFVNQNVVGGWGHSRVVNNVVVVRGGSVGQKVIGGFGDDEIFNNYITVSGGSVNKDVIGGLSHEGAVMGNVVTIEGGSMSNSVYGGHSESGNSAGNTVAVSGGSVGRHLFGGMSDGAYTTENTVTISGGSIGGSVYGGMSEDGAISNVVTISGGSVGGTVSGGASESGEVSNSVVTVSGGSVGESVLGGLCVRGRAINNIVTISGSPNLAKAQICGGVSFSNEDAFTGNTLNFKSSGISAGAVGNFERYNFYLPESVAADGIMLGVTEPVDLEGATVEIFLQGSAKLNKGDKIVLIHSFEGVKNSPKNKSCQVKQGGALYKFSLYTDKNHLWAEVEQTAQTPPSCLCD